MAFQFPSVNMSMPPPHVPIKVNQDMASAEDTLPPSIPQPKSSLAEIIAQTEASSECASTVDPSGGCSVAGSSSVASGGRKLMTAADAECSLKVTCYRSGCKTPAYFISTAFHEQLIAQGKKVTCRACIARNQEFVDHECAGCGELFLTRYQESQLRKRYGESYGRPRQCRNCSHK